MTGRVAEPTWDFTCPGQEGTVWAKKWYNRRREGGPSPPQRRTPVSSPAAAAGGTPRDPGPRGRTGGGGGGCGRTGFCGDEPSLTGTAPGRPPRSRAEQGQHGAHREGAPASDNPRLGSPQPERHARWFSWGSWHRGLGMPRHMRKRPSVPAPSRNSASGPEAWLEAGRSPQGQPRWEPRLEGLSVRAQELARKVPLRWDAALPARAGSVASILAWVRGPGSVWTSPALGVQQAPQHAERGRATAPVKQLNCARPREGRLGSHGAPTAPHP